MQLAEVAGVDQPARFAIPGLPAEVLVHDERHARALGRRNHLLRLSIRRRQRLLADHRHAARGGCTHQLEVCVRRGDDVDEIGPCLLQQLFQRCIRWQSVH
jgi:hypothetical protein